MNTTVMLTATVAMNLFQMRGGITFYHDGFEGKPLGCNWPNLIYDCESWEGDPWVALPLELFHSGYFQCGDKIEITFHDGSKMYALALDMCPGCLHFKERSSGLPFVADLPKCWRNGMVTSSGTIENLSAKQRYIQGFRREPPMYF